MERNSYGSRPDLLPRFIADPDAGAGRGVLKLNLAESRQLESESLNRFEPSSNGGLDWEGTSYQNQLWFDDEAGWATLIADLLSAQVERGSRVVIFWGTLVMPTVTLPANLAVSRASEILLAGPNFWIYSPEDKLLIECMQDGQVTIATVPTE